MNAPSPVPDRATARSGAWSRDLATPEADAARRFESLLRQLERRSEAPREDDAVAACGPAGSAAMASGTSAPPDRSPAADAGALAPGVAKSLILQAQWQRMAAVPALPRQVHAQVLDAGSPLQAVQVGQLPRGALQLLLQLHPGTTLSAAALTRLRQRLDRGGHVVESLEWRVDASPQRDR